MGQLFRRALGVVACFAVLNLSALAVASPVDDANRSAARSLGAEGVSAYQAGNYATATDKLERAYQLLKAPSLGLWSARALEKVGKLVQAGERYVEVTRLPVSGDTDIQKRAQADALTEFHAIEARIPTVTIAIEGSLAAATTTITLDGDPVASALVGERRPVDPGKHHLEATNGGRHATADVTVAAGEHAEAVLHFAATSAAAANVPAASAVQGAGSKPVDSAPPPSRGSTQKTLGFVALAVGGAGVVFGAVTGVVAIGKRSNLTSSSACSENHCLASESERVNSFSSLRTLSSLGFIAGGAIAATGVVLLLTTPSDEEHNPSAELVLTPSAAWLRGHF